MATDRLRTENSNPRGIPEAAFIENISDFLNPKTSTDADVNNFLNELQMRLEQYKFMNESKNSTLSNLEKKIPDIQNTLTMCKFLKISSQADNEDNDDDDDDDANKVINVDYQLNDTIYTSAVISKENCQNVSLWLGANVMLEYPIDEAITMLEERLDKTIESKNTTLEDLDFLRSNITTMEVNTARVYNWDVQRRKEQAAKAESSKTSV